MFLVPRFRGDSYGANLTLPDLPVFGCSSQQELAAQHPWTVLRCRRLPAGYPQHISYNEDEHQSVLSPVTVCRSVLSAFSVLIIYQIKK